MTARGQMLGSRANVIRTLIAVAIVVLIAAIFLVREVFNDEDDRGFGLLDDRRAKIGREAPDFALEDARNPGQTLRLSDFRGQTVVLNFWASWCLPCVREFPLLDEADREHSDLVVLGVDFKEGASTSVGFASERGATFPIALERNGDVTQRYAPRGLPGTFFIDADGIVRAITFGPVFDELLPAGIAAADAGTATDDGSDEGALVDLGDETGDVVVVNTTDQTLLVILNGTPQGMIAPGEERVLGQYREGTTFGRLIARPSPDDPPVFRPWVTWEFLVEANFRIEIVDQSGG